MAKKPSKKIGILTAGSDCPGLNAAIRAIGKALQGAYGMEIVGFLDGFQGLIEDRVHPLVGNSLSNILTAGGTILGTSRELLQATEEGEGFANRTVQAIETYRRHGLEALICIGGRETQECARLLMQKGLNIVTLPKAIDNDVNGTDMTIGFDTAAQVAAESIDRLHSTAHSLHRIIIVELMGRNVGWLTLAAGVSSGADVILIPEIPYDIQKASQAILRRCEAGKGFSIVAVSERVISKEEIAFRQRLRQINAGKRTGEERERVDARLANTEGLRSNSTYHVSNRLKENTGLETRMTILGYLLRGGAPTANDRFLATQLGTACAELIYQRRYGVMVAVRRGRTEPIPLNEISGGHKYVPLDHPWIQSARLVGTELAE